jgi:hypothetical protein
MSKPRPDSLYAKLKPAQREELLLLLLEQGGSYEDGVAKLSAWGVSSSAAALSRFVSRHGLPWRLDRARAAAEETKSSLPKDWEAEKARGLALKSYELTFRDLSAKEWVMLKQIEIREREQKLKESDLELKERRVKLLEDNQREAKKRLEGIKSKGGLTPETLKQIEEAAKLL